MTEHFADRLVEAIRIKNTPACVGLDPTYEHLPPAIRAQFPEAGGVVEALRVFSRRVLEIVADLVGVVKINIAFFEPYRGPGIDLYFELVAYARQLGMLVIGDVKRGDIGHTGVCYAAGQLADKPSPDAGVGPDAVTVNAYFGTGGLAPFLDVCRAQGKGVFVLVHTSNASAGEVQHLETTGGVSVAEAVAGLVHGWAHADGMMGGSGYSAVGAVVAPGDVTRAKRLRALLPDSVFLVPGFGAQGRSLEQVAACFKDDGSGALVNSSRGIIFAHENPTFASGSPADWEASVRRACEAFVETLGSIRHG